MWDYCVHIFQHNLFLSSGAFVQFLLLLFLKPWEDAPCTHSRVLVTQQDVPLAVLWSTQISRAAPQKWSAIQLLELHPRPSQSGAPEQLSVHRPLMQKHLPGGPYPHHSYLLVSPAASPLSFHSVLLSLSSWTPSAFKNILVDVPSSNPTFCCLVPIEQSQWSLKKAKVIPRYLV